MKTSIQEALRRRHRKGDEGFTLIELLVVILIIAILAAVGIIALLSALNAGRKSSATTTLRNGITSVRAVQTGAGTSDFRTLATPNLPETVMGLADSDIDWEAGATSPNQGENSVSILSRSATVIVISTRSDEDVCYYALLNTNPGAGRSTVYDSAAGPACAATTAPTTGDPAWENTTTDGWNL